MSHSSLTGDHDHALDPATAVLRTIGRATPEEWLRALARKRLTPRQIRPKLERLSPRYQESLARSEVGIFVPRVPTPAVSVRAAKNPAPGTSFGFVGTFASVETKAHFLDGFLVLKADPKTHAHVRPETVRLFRWNQARQRYEPVAHSRADSDGGFVVARIASGGLYALIGLHLRPEVVETVRLACALRAWFRGLSKDARRSLETRLCQLILCAGDAAGSGGVDFVDPAGDVCQLCLGMPEDRLFDLPECHILGEEPFCRDSAWESLGPFEIVGTPNEPFNRGIGCAKQLAIDPTDHRRIYATGEHGGVWVLKRADTWPDNRWTPIGDALEGLQMRALAIARSDSNRLYVGNGLGFVYRSTDRGASWSKTSDVNFGFIRRILIHRSQPDTVYVAANSGLYLSSNGGENWAQLLDAAEFTTFDVLDAAMDPDDSSVLYIGVRGQGVFKSYDSGQNWQPVLPFSAAAEPNRQMIRLSLGLRNTDGSSQTDADRTLAVKFGREVFVSADGGRTQPQSMGLRGGGGGHRRRSDQGRRGGEWCNVLAVDPHNPSVILAGQEDLFKTTDGGATWRRISGNDSGTPPDGLGSPGRLVHEDFQDICFDSEAPGVAYIACDGGVYLYQDGRVTDPDDGDVDTETFQERNVGFAVSQFFRVGVRGDVAVGNLDHNGLKGTTDVASGQWQKANRRGGNNGLEFNYIYADPKRDRRFYVVQPEGGGQLRRLRFPSSGDPASDLLPYAPFTPYLSMAGPITQVSQFASLPVGPIAVDMREGSNILLVCAERTEKEGFRLMMTTEADREPGLDAAGNATGLPAWQVAFDNGTDPLVSVVFAPSAQGSAYAISAAGRVIAKTDISAGAADDGWEVRGQWAQTDVRQLVVNAKFSDRLYAVSGKAFGRSPDGGRTWPDAGITTPDGRELNSIAVHPRDPHTLFIGADTGVFITHDEGANWSPYDDGLPNAEVTQVFVESGYLYAVTHGRGLWRRRFC